MHPGAAEEEQGVLKTPAWEAEEGVLVGRLMVRGTIWAQEVGGLVLEQGGSSMEGLGV